MVKRYVLIDTDDANPSDIDFELGPVYTETAPTASSYLDAASADALAASRPTNAAWSAASSVEKLAALEEATRRIDSMMLRGVRYEEKYIENGVQKDSNSDGLTQTLEFPRYIDGVICDWDAGTKLPIVPNQVLWACLEEAMAIMGAGSGSLKDLQEQGVSSMSIGGKLSYTFIAGAGNSGLQSAAANRYMRRYIGAEVR